VTPFRVELDDANAFVSKHHLFREPHARGTKLGQKRRWLWLTGIDRAALSSGEK
jgi:hypothetical protein